jgi:hypothetical protein
MVSRFLPIALAVALMAGGAAHAADEPAPGDAAPGEGPAMVAPPPSGTQSLMQQLRDIGLEPEQDGMDPQGLSGGRETQPGLLDLLRRQREAREAEREAAEDPGEPILSLSPWLVPDVRAELRAIVQELSRYARTRQPGFAILARGGAPLAFRTRRAAVLEAARAARAGHGELEPDSPAAGIGEPASGFLAAIDGFVIDGQFCGEPPVSDEDMVRLADLNMVLASIDHCASPDIADEARRRARTAGVLIHADTDPQGRLDTIPTGRPWGENSDNITDPQQARSILVLEDASAFGDVSLLIGALRETNHDILVLDPFVLGEKALAAQHVRELRYKKLGARRLVMASFDVGYANADEYYWKPTWDLGDPRWLSATALGRPGAHFTEFWDPAWKKQLGEYFVAVMDLGFDGVMIDGLDAFKRWEAIMAVE